MLIYDSLGQDPTVYKNFFKKLVCFVEVFFSGNESGEFIKKNNNELI